MKFETKLISDGIVRYTFDGDFRTFNPKIFIRSVIGLIDESKELISEVEDVSNTTFDDHKINRFIVDLEKTDNIDVYFIRALNFLQNNICKIRLVHKSQKEIIAGLFEDEKLLIESCQKEIKSFDSTEEAIQNFV